MRFPFIISAMLSLFIVVGAGHGIATVGVLFLHGTSSVWLLLQLTVGLSLITALVALFSRRLRVVMGAVSTVMTTGTIVLATLASADMRFTLMTALPSILGVLYTSVAALFSADGPDHTP